MNIAPFQSLTPLGLSPLAPFILGFGPKEESGAVDSYATATTALNSPSYFPVPAFFRGKHEIMAPVISPDDICFACASLPDHSPPTWQDRLRFIEASLTRNAYLAGDLTGKTEKNQQPTPEEAASQYHLYRQWLNEIAQLSRVQIKRATKLPFEQQFILLYRVSKAMEHLRHRWFYYFRHWCTWWYEKNCRPWLSEHLCFNDETLSIDIANKIERLFHKYPTLKTAWQNSMSDIYRLLYRHQQNLLHYLKQDAQKDPKLLIEFVRTFFGLRNFSSDYLFDDILDEILGLEVERTEQMLYQKPEYSCLRDSYYGSFQNGVQKTLPPGEEQIIYEGTPYGRIMEFLDATQPTRDDVVYDLGFGYGRVTKLTAMLTPSKVVGIELLPERVAKAEKAKQKIELANLEYRAGNVLEHDFSDGTLFYLFNPFATPTLKKFIERLKGVAEEKKKDGKNIRVAFWGDKDNLAHFENQRDWLEPTAELDKVHLYKSF